MHKKPLVAVLIFGLLLLVHSVGFADENPTGKNPYLLSADGQMLPRVARALDKGPVDAPTALSGPTTIIQAGVSRTGATFCDGEWQGGGVGQYASWFYGDEFYAAYQDPENLGTCTGLPDVYTFDVTAINWFVVENTGNTTYDMQPLVYANGGDFSCAIPGAVLCAGPLYSVLLSATGSYIISLPFAAECCVYEDYFAGIYAGPFMGTGFLGLVTSGNVDGPCLTYNDWGGGWADLSSYLGNPNLELWSEGMTYDQNSCPGTPGLCNWEWWYTGAAYFWGMPDANGSADRFVRFNPDVSCTLMQIDAIVYGGGVVGTPTLRVRLYGNNGPIYGGRMYPGQDAYGPGDPSNLVAEWDVPWASITTFPGYTSIDCTTFPGWPAGFVYGTGENLFVSMDLSPNTPDPVNDVMSTLTDDGGGSGHSGFYCGACPYYLYYDEAFGTDYGNLLDVYFCCEVVEVTEVNCANPGPDNWPTWGHDYARTCATSIEIGDPCQVTAKWIQPMLGALNSFNEPTIADGRVYSSVDNQLNTFDLLTGLPGNTVAGLPHIFASNRGNMTTDGGFTYVTGGNAQAIGQWTADLGTNNWVNGIGVGAAPLGGNCRFGVTAVYEAEPGVEVIVVGTESGNLWCFETATGAIYGGWAAANPVILDDGIWHSPAYDGDALYIGTANTSAVEGNVYKIDAATGAIVWTFTPANPLEGFPGGVSLDGNYVYAASGDAGLAGSRSRIDKGTGVADWEFGQSRALYGVPAIGRNFVYINQDVGGAGVLVVDKGTGAALYNFAANGVGPVTQHVTVTCDNYLFAGDRNGVWWLLDVNDQAVEFSQQFNGIVSGTAIASGSDMAVISIRSGNSVDGGGYVVAYEFNAGLRPRVALNRPSIDIPVPFGTGLVVGQTETDLLSNMGCADLTVATQVNDPNPDVDFASMRLINEESRYATATANSIVGADYTAYFYNSSKSARMANRPLELVTDELTRGDVAIENARKAIVDSKRSSSRMAADASVPDRTHNVSVATPIAAGNSATVTWDYHGTSLERGRDVEEIEFLTNDPDALFFGVNPIFTITYIGGCLDDFTTVVWNTAGAANEEEIYNYGSVGDDDATESDLIWGADPNGGDAGNMYDGSFVLAGGVAPNVDTAQFYYGNMYDNWPNSTFLGNPRPSDGACDFDSDVDVLMGYKRTLGCPGTPVEILGAWARAYFVDSNAAFAGTVYEAIGLEISMTEVGAYDPEYGDFAILKWDFTERYGDTEDIYAGTLCDWDVAADYGSNHGIVSDMFNGYALWDHVSPGLAYGFLDPRMPTAYCGVDPTATSPHVIQELGQRAPGGGGGMYDLWQGDGVDDVSLLWERLTTGRRESGPHELAGDLEDHGGLLVNKMITLGPLETKSAVQVKFAVDAASNDNATIEALATGLAKRAAIWGGWARGDANMDGCVNLIDVCWLGSGNQIYPDTYNGDVNIDGIVDNADAIQLLNYVTGIPGNDPLGKWRFAF